MQGSNCVPVDIAGGFFFIEAPVTMESLLAALLNKDSKSLLLNCFGVAHGLYEFRHELGGRVCGVFDI